MSFEEIVRKLLTCTKKKCPSKIKNMLKEKILNKVDALITQARELELGIMQNADFYKDFQAFALLTSALATISEVVGEKSQFFLALDRIPKVQPAYIVRYISATLSQFRQYIDEGWSSGVRNLISAEIFDNFLEMAEYLLKEEYKDPAAVIIGSTLESHLRDLCNSRGVSIAIVDPSSGKIRAIKANKMNEDLAKAGVYNALEQKSVLAWLDLRNKAAHGEYEEYNKAQVTNMLNGVREFIIRNPA